MAIWLLIAALFGLSGVALDAAGTHAMVATPPQDQAAFATAARYQLLHALALLGVAWLASRTPRSRLVWLSGLGFTLGIILFSGSIYLRKLAAVDWASAATPAGGICLMAGWAAFALYAVSLLLKSGRQ